MLWPSVYGVPVPFAKVFQPANSKPDLVNELVVRAVATSEVIDWFAMVPEPVLLLKTKVFEFAVHCA